MKTIINTAVMFAGFLALAACAADAQTAAPAFGPGSQRHQQMVEQWQKDGTPPGPAAMGQFRGRGPGMGMMGRTDIKLGPDGKVDPATLPQWCPYSPQATTK